MNGRHSILIIEDDASLSTILADKFRTEGFDVDVARDGEAGLHKALAAQPAMILLDILMPKKDGATTFVELRKDAWGKTAKVIFLTNLGDQETALKYAEDPNCDYILKSEWKLNDIVALVKKKLAPPAEEEGE